MVTYSAAAEASFYTAMGWPRPDHVVDLWAEFMALCNGPGREPKEGFALTGCLEHFGLHHPYDETEKAALQARCWAGGPWQAGERDAILTYNRADVEVMLPLLDRLGRVARWRSTGWPPFPRAVLFRGLYSWCTHHVQAAGIPVDADLVHEIRDKFPQVRPELLRRLDVHGFQDDHGVLKVDRMDAWVQKPGRGRLAAHPHETLQDGRGDTRPDEACR